jgi:hypothetical protein
MGSAGWSVTASDGVTVQPPLGTERLGVVPPARVRVNDALGEHERRTLGDVMAAEGHGFEWLPEQRVQRRVAPHRLPHDGLRVREGGEVLDGRVAVDLVDLGGESVGRVRARGEQVAGVRQRERGRLVAGEQDGDEVVPEPVRFGRRGRVVGSSRPGLSLGAKRSAIDGMSCGCD